MAVAQFSGLASGIDSASLIDAIVAARQTVNDQRKEDIDFLQSENEALEELNTKIIALNDALDVFRTVNGGGVNKKASTSDSSVATAAVSASANNATITLNVTSVASGATASFNDAYASSSSIMAANAVGTQTIGVDIGLGGNLVSVDVNITNATTVQQYIDQFNANANAAGRVTASLINVGTSSSPSYRIAFTSLKSGTDLGTIAFDVPTGAAGFGGFTDLQTRTTDQATDAKFTMSGVSGTITRATNAVSDVLTGVTFNFTRTGTAEINVGDDADSTADLFQTVVDAYNDIVAYINENDTVTREESDSAVTNTYGILAKTRVDNDFMAQFQSKMRTATSTGGTEVKSLSDLGISTQRDGTLKLDVDEFKTKVGADPSGAGTVLRSFADASAGVNGFMYQYTTYHGFIDIQQDGNNDQIGDLNKQIEQLNRYTDKMRTTLQKQFSSLERITAKMQSAQQALTAVLAGLG